MIAKAVQWIMRCLLDSARDLVAAQGGGGRGQPLTPETSLLGYRYFRVQIFQFNKYHITEPARETPSSKFSAS